MLQLTQILIDLHCTRLPRNIVREGFIHSEVTDTRSVLSRARRYRKGMCAFRRVLLSPAAGSTTYGTSGTAHHTCLLHTAGTGRNNRDKCSPNSRICPLDGSSPSALFRRIQLSCSKFEVKLQNYNKLQVVKSSQFRIAN